MLNCAKCNKAKMTRRDRGKLRRSKNARRREEGMRGRQEHSMGGRRKKPGRKLKGGEGNAGKTVKKQKRKDVRRK